MEGANPLPNIYVYYILKTFILILQKIFQFFFKILHFLQILNIQFQ